MQKTKYARSSDPFLLRLEDKIRNGNHISTTKAPEEIQIETVIRFKIDERTGKLFPAVKPSTGDLVDLQPGEIGKSIIVSERWTVDHPLTLMSILLIWDNNYEYPYQIRPTNDPATGFFVQLKPYPVPPNKEKKGRSSQVVGIQKI